MVKHNGTLPNQHFRKDWDKRVRMKFNQPAHKLKRRQKRAAKAKALGVRPLNKLRPAVQCCTQRYNSKTRYGRGFSLEELKGAGLVPAYAATIGIAVDRRRLNRSEEGLKRNVDRLKEYLSKLIVYPRKASKPKKGDSTDVSAAVAQNTDKHLLPLSSAKPVEWVTLTDEMKGHSAVEQYKAAKEAAKEEGKSRHKKSEDDDKKE